MKKLVMLVCLASPVLGEDFISYTIQREKEKSQISIVASPLTKDPFKKIFPPFANLLGDGVVAYENDATATIEARLMNHTRYWDVHAQEGNAQLTEYLLQSLDEKIFPVFSQIIAKAKKEWTKTKEEQAKQAGELLGVPSPRVAWWYLPTGYAFAEEIRITLDPSPSKVVLLYKQNLQGTIKKNEQVLLLDSEYHECLMIQGELQKAWETFHFSLTGENDEGKYIRLLKHEGLIRNTPVRERYFSDARGNVWCPKHLAPGITPNTIKEKCAWQQRLLHDLVKVYYDETEKYPDIEHMSSEFSSVVSHPELLFEPGGGMYKNNKEEVICGTHGKLY